MRRVLGFCALSLIALGTAFSQSQYPLRTIRAIQEVSIDSLRVLDTLQRTQPSRWTLQRSLYYHDTVRVRGVVVVPARYIGYNTCGYNMLIADTASTNEWGGLWIKPNFSCSQTPLDSLLAIQWGITSVTTGDYVELSGWIDEFPDSDPVSATQLVPVYSRPLTVLSSAPVPPHVAKLVSDFYVGLFSAPPPYPPNGIQFSKGEPMEFMRVQLSNLIVTGTLNLTNGTFNMVDQSGNMISTMDASVWFTTRGHRDPTSTYTVPSVGRVVDTIRGYIQTISGGEAPRGYRISPVFPGDIVYGAVALPVASTHRRSPIVVVPDSTPVVSVRVARGGVGIQSVQLRYSVTNGPFTNVPMTYTSSDTTWRGTIPQQAADTFVKYYINVMDSVGNNVKLASSATDGSQSDTLGGFFFYYSLNRAVTIRDIQYTPFPNGRSAYIAARVTIRGIVTADTASLGLPPTPFRGTNVWYLQTTNAPWNGIWINNDSISATLNAMHNGDSVGVTGTVAEHIMDSQTSYVTRLQALDPPIIYSSNNPAPTAVVLPTNTFGASVGKGTPSAEQWEGMLVQFNNVTLSDTMPIFQLLEEFAGDDGTGQVIIRKDGKHNYTQLVSEVGQGRTLIPFRSHISYLRGVVHFSGNRYKIVPRTATDFGTITSVDIDRGAGVPATYALGQNYPNPFNPSTTIEFSVPTSGQVTVKVYNVLGQEVETLVNGIQDPGKYTIRFDASRYTSGLYFYRLQAGQFLQTKKMLLLK